MHRRKNKNIGLRKYQNFNNHVVRFGRKSRVNVEDSEGDVMSAVASPSTLQRNKPYDYLLKFLLVGDSDVGKEEILSSLGNGASDSPYGGHSGMQPKLTVFRVHLCDHDNVAYRGPCTAVSF